MDQPRMIQPKDTAKNFSLKDQNDKTFDLLEQAGKRVLLSFHPLAWTAFCAGQMKSLEENRAALGALNTVAVGISVDSVPCKKAWAESLKITDTRLLSDFWPHGKVAQTVRPLQGRERLCRAGQRHRRREADGHLREGLSHPQRAGYRGSDRGAEGAWKEGIISREREHERQDYAEIMFIRYFHGMIVSPCSTGGF